jgi:4-hydroxybenzoate polyprenyltransferase
MKLRPLAAAAGAEPMSMNLLSSHNGFAKPAAAGQGLPLVTLPRREPRRNWNLVHSFLAVNRVEYFPVQVTIFIMPLLLGAGSRADLARPQVLEGLLALGFVFILGNVINCLADRELDRTYKSRLARAVDSLGVRFVTGFVVVNALLAFIVGAHLAWTLRSWAILVLVYLETVLAIQYSFGPCHFKSRGVLQLPCLWLGLYFLPMVYFALLVSGQLAGPMVLLAGAYGTLEMGLILVNTSEDLPEDTAHGLRTITVALGLGPTLWLAAGMVLLGGLGFVGMLAFLFLPAVPAAWSVPALLVLLAGCTAAFVSSWRLARRVAAVAPAAGIRLVKASGWLVPLWCTLLGWIGLACGLIYLLGRSA